MAKKKGKGKKKNKEAEEQERLLREQEERLQLEAELIRQEEERLQREEEERLRLEAERKLRASELERLASEDEAARPLFERQAKQLASELEEEARHVEWEAYTACNPRPNATITSELNTYINEWSENSSTSLPQTMGQCEYTEEIVSDIEIARASALARDDKDRVSMSDEFITRLRKLEGIKLDSVTAHILQARSCFYHHAFRFSSSDPHIFSVAAFGRIRHAQE